VLTELEPVFVAQKGCLLASPLCVILRIGGTLAGLVLPEVGRRLAGTGDEWVPYRLLATDLVNNGLPIHIGAALLGHLNLQTAREYVAVFNEDVVRHYQEFLDRRRKVRSADEYISLSPTVSGPNLRNTSTGERSSWAVTHDHTVPIANMSIRVCVAQCLP
jgi:hypothetical protein